MTGGRYNPRMVHRSRRIPKDLSLNRLAEARARIGEIPYDLTISNPTVCGLPYPSDLLKPFADPHGLVYEPQPRGTMMARGAVAAEFGRWRTAPDPEHIVLTTSTSEAYSFLFRTFCDPGDTVLVPSPSYPLFEHLARLDGIVAASYVLDPEDGWRIDFRNIEDAPEGVRAVVVVHPNNPTGSFVQPEDRERLIALGQERGWALIADEVFLPYLLDGGPGGDTSFAAVDGCLCCTLGGFSKSLGLPQLKLAWIVVTGPDELVGPTIEGLDYVADAYLSVSTPVAGAAARLLVDGAGIRNAITARCRTNLAALRELVSDYPAFSAPAIGGGWSALLRVPTVIDEEELCLRLLEERGVGAHPGSFYGFASGTWLVLSLLPTPETFAEGLHRSLGFLDQTIRSR
jgi:aspartate/methionine/tyrosine aminotransferase